MFLPALPFPRIDPILIEFGPLAIRWYALAYVVGILLGWLYARRLVARKALWGAPGAPIATAQVDDFVTWIAIGLILGGRIGYVVFYNPAFYWQNPSEILAVWHGGMSFHGGLVGSIIASWLFARHRKIRFSSLLDIATAAAPIGLFFGRLANFVNGELWGRVTDLPFAVIFPAAGPDPRHPSQIYEAALEGLVLFLVLRFLTHSRHALAHPGRVAGSFALGYGSFRIFVEFFREPDVQIGFLPGGLTMGMVLSLPLAALGLWLILRTRHRSAQGRREDAAGDV